MRAVEPAQERREHRPRDARPEPAPACEVSACDDANACTADDCTAEGCSNRVLSDGTLCGIDRLCAHGACLEPECRAQAECDDGNPCNGAEQCGIEGVCLTGPAPDCGAPTQCAVPTCIADSGCAMLPLRDGTSCDDGNRDTRKDRRLDGTCQGRPKRSASRGPRAR